MVYRMLTVFVIAITIAINTPLSAADNAPENYKVKFETSAGDFMIDVERKLAPQGADRFYELVNKGFYDDCRFFRVVPNFVVQFGINGNPAVQKNWRDAKIEDDPVRASNVRGTITFATSGPNSRTTQLFINLQDNERLDNLGFSPFGKVSEGMNVVDKINAQYREQPNQGLIQSRGNAYLIEKFPRLDFIKSAKVVKPKS